MWPISGGIIQLTASEEIFIDGQLLSDGDPAQGQRAGGGSGGSIYINTRHFRGHGKLSTRGGDVNHELDADSDAPDGSKVCTGGGGAGGRIAIHYNETSFGGTIMTPGGRSQHECGGAGTIIWNNYVLDLTKLVVDNNGGSCHPLEESIPYDKFVGGHKGRDSYRTWLFDEPDSHQHQFSEVEITGNAQLALYRNAYDSFLQTVFVSRTSGDRTGIFHVGPDQVNCLIYFFHVMFSPKYV